MTHDGYFDTKITHRLRFFFRKCTQNVHNISSEVCEITIGKSYLLTILWNLISEIWLTGISRLHGLNKIFQFKIKINTHVANWSLVRYASLKFVVTLSVVHEWLTFNALINTICKQCSLCLSADVGQFLAIEKFRSEA